MQIISTDITISGEGFPSGGNIMGAMSVWHWVILLVVVALVFGTGKLKNLGSDLGGAIRGFKEGMKDESGSDEKTDSGENNARK